MLVQAALVTALVGLACGCGFPGAPAHSTVTFSTDAIGVGTVATYTCDRGFELLGPARKECQGNSTWAPAGIPFCVINVAAGKAPMQSSTAQGGIPQKAVDGSTSGFFNPKTCTLTEQETSPLWYVNLLEPYMVQLVRLDFGRSCCEDNIPATIVVRVGNNRPDLKINPICNRFTGFMEEGRPLFLPCNPPMPGAFISVHLEGPPGQMLSICEAFVYTDQALPIERCPQFRDQPPGSTATYNGKCYTFYNQQPQSFAEAQEFCQGRGGTLIDETNPALQGFLSWELWRRHREDPNGQYWMGAVRDPQNPGNWKWINGQDLGVSFWSLPGGQENCARFDGTKDWLWSDTNCNLRLNFICQHQPLTCGKPEQPPNSTLIAPDFNVGSRIAYRCEEGHLLSGPEERECLSTGFYSAYPPTCKNLQCGMPASIKHGRYSLVNDTRGYMSMVVYECDEDFVMVGRNELICDVDERWGGPPPRCEPVFCKEPPAILNGGFRVSTNSTIVGTLVEYYCLDDRFTLTGPRTLRCMRDGTYNQEPPVCRETEQSTSTNPAPTFDTPLADDDPLVIAASELSEERQYTGFSAPNRPADDQPTYEDPLYDDIAYDESSLSTPEPTDPTVPPTSPPYTVLPGDRVVVKDVEGEKRRRVFIFRRQSTTLSPEEEFTETPTSTVQPTAPTEPAPTVPDEEEEGEEQVTGPRPTDAESPSPTLPPSTVADTGTDVWSDAGTTVPFESEYITTEMAPVQREKPQPGPPAPRLSQRRLQPETPWPWPAQASSASARPEENEIPDTVNIRQNAPGVREPANTLDERSTGPKLHMGGIIALSVFGGFVFLAAVVTTIVILIRRNRGYHQRRSHPNANSSSYSTESETHGLNKYYKRAWENLQSSGRQERKSGSGGKSRGEPTMRSEMYRDASELTVADVAHMYRGEDKRRHHHHHHRHHHKDEHDRAERHSRKQ
ncbi:sushi, von Willebrand factor type A, EGF and pentraxin domain-containing protein 1-like [Pollicipes pollicipes]|uniref:sushi, von Willebrand factor type A, EGF and pentraxin domain-containing protein 1-like n=1 Tax=Pollicipes pollicipes TaxID=41117 RepID=UPI0018854652|nr:sushi, von Willebrand factor type A, EGF and pentraxin domain-containing protein 1-like [Pollicipes pollicipes]